MRNIYSTTRVDGSLFVKEYDNHIGEELVKDEYEKATKLFELGLGPKPVSFSGRTISLQAVDKPFVELADFIFKNNNVRNYKPEIIRKVLYRIGFSLGKIHRELKLSKKESLGWKVAPHKKVFLYGDLGLKSVLIKDDNLIFIDPGFNLINDKVCLFDSFYYDLAYFIFSIRYLVPLKRRPFYNFSSTESFIKSFLDGYVKSTEEIIILSLLKIYENKVREEYNKTLNNDFIGKIWRRIINDGNKKILEPCKEIRCVQGGIPTTWK
jgi:tRNA A-37 threonylcarbamoyl transferase component Bud32